MSWRRSNKCFSYHLEIEWKLKRVNERGASPRHSFLFALLTSLQNSSDAAADKTGQRRHIHHDADKRTESGIALTAKPIVTQRAVRSVLLSWRMADEWQLNLLSIDGQQAELRSVRYQATLLRDPQWPKNIFIIVRDENFTSNKKQNRESESLSATHLQANWRTAHQESLNLRRWRPALDAFSATFPCSPSGISECDSMKSSSKKMSYSFCPE